MQAYLGFILLPLWGALPDSSIFHVVGYTSAEQISDKFATQPPVRDGRATPNYIQPNQEPTDNFPLVPQYTTHVRCTVHCIYIIYNA